MPISNLYVTMSRTLGEREMHETPGKLVKIIVLGNPEDEFVLKHCDMVHKVWNVDIDVYWVGDGCFYSYNPPNEYHGGDINPFF